MCNNGCTWVPDNDKVWVMGKVTKQMGRAELLVSTDDGHQVKVDMNVTPELFTVNPTVEDDMTSLWYLHEPGILDNLRKRAPPPPGTRPPRSIRPAARSTIRRPRVARPGRLRRRRAVHVRRA